MSATGRILRATNPRLAHSAIAEVRRHIAVEALIAEIDGEQVRDFIMGNPCPALERAFEDELWTAGFKDAFCKVEGDRIQIMFDFEAQPPPRLHDLAVHIRSIAAELRPEQSCGTISSVRRGDRVVVTFRFEPRRSGWEQFSRHRQRSATGAQGPSGSESLNIPANDSMTAHPRLVETFETPRRLFSLPFIMSGSVDFC